MKKKSQASITIYLSMTLVLVLVLVCTVIESGRVSAIKTKLRGITYMGADSVFSEFASEVFDKYGIMMLWMNEDEFISEFSGFAEANIDGSSSGTDLYGMSYVNSVINDVSLITDEDGEIFRNQVSDYMKLKLIETSVDTLLSKLNIFDQGGLIDGLMDKIKEFEDVFSKVEDVVSSIKETVDKAKSAAGDLAGLLSQLKEYAGEYLESSDSSYAAKFSTALGKLENVRTKIREYLEKIRSQTENYINAASDAKVAVGYLEEYLVSGKEDYDDDIYSAATEQIDEIKEKSSDLDADYYNVLKNDKATENCLEQNSKLGDLVNMLAGGLSSDNAETYIELISDFTEKYSDLGLEELAINLDTTITEQKSSGFLDTVTGLFNEGFLALVAENVSEKELSALELPSLTAERGGGEDAGNLKEVASETFLFSEYVLEHFGNYVNTLDDSALDYEVEYILTGKDSDKDNLAAVAEKLVLIRSGCNMISLLKSSEMREEALVLATALVGALGMPLLIRLMQVVIMSAWSLAESISDVKTLLSGGKVITIKDKDDWAISIYGLENINSSGITSKSAEKGLEYHDYLRILLLLQNKSNQTFRTMDLIQANMCTNFNEAFRISECITKVELQVEYKARQLFVSLPFVKKYIGDGSGYSFTFTQEYSY